MLCRIGWGSGFIDDQDEFEFLSRIFLQQTFNHGKIPFSYPLQYETVGHQQPMLALRVNFQA